MENIFLWFLGYGSLIYDILKCLKIEFCLLFSDVFKVHKSWTIHYLQKKILLFYWTDFIFALISRHFILF